MKRIASVFLSSALVMTLLCPSALAIKGVVIDPSKANYITPEEMQALEEQAKEGVVPPDLEGTSFGPSIEVDIPTAETFMEPDDPSISRPSSWAESEIEAASMAGLIVDFTDDPDFQDPITREQFAELAFNAVLRIKDGPTTIKPVSFTDTDNKLVQRAAGLGIVNGVGEGRFDPKATTNREQIATMLYRAWGLVGTPAQSQGLDAYADGASVSSWAADAVGAMAASGIMKGTSGTTLSPADPCTVEQAILLVYRLYLEIK